MKNIMKNCSILLGFILLIISCTPEPAVPSGTAYIYGVTQYGGLWYDLSYTDDDARDMARIFFDAGYDVRLRIDDGSEDGTKPATVEQLEEDIAEFTPGAAAGGVFVFFFSGHGLKYLPEDADIDEPSHGDDDDEWLLFYGFIPGVSSLQASDGALTDNALSAMLEDIQGAVKLVILDSCYSGGFIGDSPFVDPVPQDSSEEEQPLFSGTVQAYFGFSENAARDISSPDTFVLAAAGEPESSREEGALANGVFTYAFLEAALHGDRDENGYITLNEIYRYMDEGWEQWPYTSGFHPHLSGSPLDLVLFRTEN